MLSCQNKNHMRREPFSDFECSASWPRTPALWFAYRMFSDDSSSSWSRQIADWWFSSTKIEKKYFIRTLKVYFKSKTPTSFSVWIKLIFSVELVFASEPLRMFVLFCNIKLLFCKLLISLGLACGCCCPKMLCSWWNLVLWLADVFWDLSWWRS